jgi:hypothetical protein
VHTSLFLSSHSSHALISFPRFEDLFTDFLVVHNNTSVWTGDKMLGLDHIRRGAAPLAAVAFRFFTFWILVEVAWARD